MFGLICAAIIGALLWGVWLSAKREKVSAGRRTAKIAALTLVWLGLLASVVASGSVSEKPTPRLPLFFVVINGVSLGIGLSPVGRWLAQSVSLGWLVEFQAFRFPPE